jgi:hypothetical protein
MVPLAAVAVAETIVDAREATVPSTVKPAAMKSAESTANPARVKAAAMEAAASVKTPAPAMRASIGEV